MGDPMTKENDMSDVALTMDEAKKLLLSMDEAKERIRKMESHLLTLGLYAEHGDVAATPAAIEAAFAEVERLKERD